MIGSRLARERRTSRSLAPTRRDPSEELSPPATSEDRIVSWYRMTVSDRYERGLVNTKPAESSPPTRKTARPRFQNAVDLRTRTIRWSSCSRVLGVEVTERWGK